MCANLIHRRPLPPPPPSIEINHRTPSVRAHNAVLLAARRFINTLSTRVRGSTRVRLAKQVELQRFASAIVCAVSVCECVCVCSRARGLVCQWQSRGFKAHASSALADASRFEYAKKKQSQPTPPPSAAPSCATSFASFARPTGQCTPMAIAPTSKRRPPTRRRPQRAAPAQRSPAV